MSFDSFTRTIKHELNPVDFAEGLYDSALRQPINAVKQLCGAHIEQPKESNKTLATSAGNLAGFIVDFTVLSKITGGFVRNSTGNMFLAGAIHGGVLTPHAENRNALTARLESGLVSGSTFAVMGGVSKRLESKAMLEMSPLLTKVGTNAIAGGAGGVIEAYGRTYFDQGRIARPDEVAGTVGQYALFGAGFGAFDHGLNVGAKKLTEIPAVRDAYYRAKWGLSDAQVEAKRTTYSVLNKLDMRHPVQRARNALFGFDPEAGAIRAPLTAANNPITAFESELPEYFRAITKHEEVIADLPRNSEQRFDLYEQEKDIKKEFAYKLLKWWHGTETEPGIRQYTDAELATGNATAERVAQIRKALTATGKNDYPNPSAFSRALAELSPYKVELNGRHDEYDVLEGFSAAKERFFGYNEDELTKRMSWSSLYHAMNRHYDTPLTWVPFEPTDKLPNLFHGTINHSLPSIFTERTLFSGKEMRLRGISQNTGESAHQEFPRRAVSLTRDFNEAWAYHRHSPDYLTSYPVVLGVSADVLPRAHYAGMLEKGEILIDKLRVGNSLLTRLGLRKPEITHIYVPDTQISAINRQLAAHRISGVRVLGLNEIPTPQWKPEPTPEELKKLYPYG